MLDSEILADVYIELIGGKQGALGFDGANADSKSNENDGQSKIVLKTRPEPLPSRLSEEDKAAHDALLAKIGEKAMWSHIKN